MSRGSRSEFAGHLAVRGLHGQGAGPVPSVNEKTPGPSPEPRPGAPTSDEVRDFAVGLSALRTQAGSPTLDQLSQRSGISKSVLSDAFSGRRLPTENTVRRLVVALDGDVTTWTARRARLDPRRGSDTSEAIAGQAAPEPVPRLARPVSLGLLLAMCVGTVVVAVGAAAGIALLIAGAGADATPPAPTATPTETYLAVADGVDPMQTVCREDAVLAGGDEFLDGAVLVEMMYSTRCMGVWGRVTRYDGKAAGNTMTIQIYPRDDPESDRAQMRSDSGLQSLYTTLLIEPDVEARVCGVATVTVDGVDFVQPNPVCI